MAEKTKKEPKLDDVMGQVVQVTQSLLEEGAEPSQVAFALTSVAADMGLQVAGDPLKVLPVLLMQLPASLNVVCKSKLKAGLWI